MAYEPPPSDLVFDELDVSEDWWQTMGVDQSGLDAIIWTTQAVAFSLVTAQYVHFFYTLPTKTEISLPERIRYHISHSRAGQGIEAVTAIMSFISCITYIWETYLSFTPLLMMISEVIFANFFAFQYFILFYESKSKLGYFFSLQALVDLVTVLPVFYVLGMGGSYQFDSVSVLRFGRVLKFARVMRLLRIFRSFTLVNSQMDDAIQNQVAMLVSTILGIIVVCTGVVHYMGNDCDMWYDIRDQDMCGTTVSFHDALYFTVVTFTTVGYGDISPGRPISRLAIIIILVAAFLLVPVQTQQLAHLLNMRSKYSGAFGISNEERHIIIACDTHMQPVDTFIRELFHEDHGVHSTKVVLLAPEEPSSEFKELLLMHAKKKRVTYVKGDALYQSHLQRARADVAVTCYVLTNRQNTDVDKQDALTVMRAISMKRMNPRMDVYVQLIQSTYRPHLLAVNIPDHHIICMNQLKLTLLAKNCVCEGFSTLITNLVSSSSFNAALFDSTWIQEYCDGQGQEIYKVEPFTPFEGMSFLEAVEAIFKSYDNVTLFGLGIYRGEGKDMQLVLNPGRDYIIKSRDVGFVMADDAEAAMELLEYERDGSEEGDDGSPGKGFFRRISRFIANDSNKVGAVQEKYETVTDDDDGANAAEGGESRRGFEPTASGRGGGEGAKDNGEGAESAAAVLKDSPQESNGQTPMKPPPPSGGGGSGGGGNARGSAAAAASTSSPAGDHSTPVLSTKTKMRRKLTSEQSFKLSSPQHTFVPRVGPSRKILVARAEEANDSAADELPALKNVSAATKRLAAAAGGEAGGALEAKAAPPLPESDAAGAAAGVGADGGGDKAARAAPLEASTSEAARAEALEWIPLSWDSTAPREPQDRHLRSKETALRKSLTSAIKMVVPEDLSDHVVMVCHSLRDMRHFVTTLRAEHLAVHRTIIFLMPQAPALSDWAEIADFEDVIVMRGSPWNEADLARINLALAYCCIVVGVGRDRSVPNVTDAEVILDVLSLEKYAPGVRVICELNDDENIRHLDPVDFSFGTEGLLSTQISYHFLPSFAGGKVVDNYIPELLLCGSFFNTTIIPMVQTLVSGSGTTEQELQGRRSSLFAPAGAGASGTGPRMAYVGQIDCPSECDGMTYDRLFVHVLREYHLLPVGLYRKGDNDLYYVMTNPAHDTEVALDDKLFVLGN
mmetsp:Transcript_1431/g.5272  ORF Transcript_1431/g.5272 Transcript_1431/m.5272 type:complete len:1180 (-) Transcript_1431:74-3613(-)